MALPSVRVVHLTDIHFSEDNFWHGANRKGRVPHRHGHSPAALIALDTKLHELNYDLLVVSGDLTRVGHEDSFSYVKSWLYGAIQKPGGGQIGLQADPKRCFVVPGNHDCFNENWKQHSLTNYHKFFPDIKRNTIERTEVNGICVNVHLYDSTYDRGGFAKGYIDPASMRGWTTDEKTLDLVVVHHHLAQSPEHKRSKALEIVNVGEFMSFLLSTRINGVFFGHTHDSFFEKISAELLRENMKSPKRWKRWLRNCFPRYFAGGQFSSLDFPKVPTRNGRFPSFDKFGEYLYIKHLLGKEIQGPDEFDEPRQFHEHVKRFRSDYSPKLLEASKRKVAFSMAPSPTYHEADNKGFHLVEFKWDGNKFIYSCEHYKFTGSTFELQ